MIEADSPPALRLEDPVNRIWVTPPSGVRELLVWESVDHKGPINYRILVY